MREDAVFKRCKVKSRKGRGRLPLSRYEEMIHGSVARVANDDPWHRPEPGTID